MHADTALPIDVHIDIEQSVQAMPNQGCLLFDIPSMKGPQDLRRYSIVIDNTRPDLIIQTGTAYGGSALWFAHNWYFGGPDVVTIDTNYGRIANRLVNDEKITLLTGSSIDAAVLREVEKRACQYQRVMVVLDSDHSADHVAAEIDAYGPLVSSGGYLVVEDGIYDFAGPGEFNPGPLSAIRSRLIGNDQWRRDIEIEKLESVSMYPAGWWVKL